MDYELAVIGEHITQKYGWVVTDILVEGDNTNIYFSKDMNPVRDTILAAKVSIHNIGSGYSKYTIAYKVTCECIGDCWWGKAIDANTVKVESTNPRLSNLDLKDIISRYLYVAEQEFITHTK